VAHTSASARHGQREGPVKRYRQQEPVERRRGRTQFAQAYENGGEGRGDGADEQRQDRKPLGAKYRGNRVGRWRYL